MSCTRSGRFTLALFFIVLFAGSLTSSQSFGQDDEENVSVAYERSGHKVFKSLASALAQPDSVFILELKGKKLTEFPEEVYRLPHLAVLDISKNRIKELPASINQLKNLQELNVASNKLNALPDEIGQLTNLKKLSLNRNTISLLPSTIGAMDSLQVLELWDNEIETLPDEIRNLKQLKVLELRGILFSDEQQDYFRELLPGVRIYMSPACDCKTN